jgi:hypothetical protein
MKPFSTARKIIASVFAGTMILFGASEPAQPEPPPEPYQEIAGPAVREGTHDSTLIVHSAAQLRSRLQPLTPVVSVNLPFGIAQKYGLDEPAALASALKDAPGALKFLSNLQEALINLDEENQEHAQRIRADSNYWGNVREGGPELHQHGPVDVPFKTLDEMVLVAKKANALTPKETDTIKFIEEYLQNKSGSSWTVDDLGGIVPVSQGTARESWADQHYLLYGEEASRHNYVPSSDEALFTPQQGFSSTFNDEGVPVLRRTARNTGGAYLDVADLYTWNPRPKGLVLSPSFHPVGGVVEQAGSQLVDDPVQKSTADAAKMTTATGIIEVVQPATSTPAGTGLLSVIGKFFEQITALLSGLVSVFNLMRKWMQKRRRRKRRGTKA